MSSVSKRESPPIISSLKLNLRQRLEICATLSGLTIFTSHVCGINTLLAVITYPPWQPAGHWWGRSLWRWREHRTHAEPGRSLYPRRRSPQPRQLYQRSSHRWLSWCRRSDSPCSRTSCRTYSAEERKKTLLHVMKQDVTNLWDRNDVKGLKIS